MKKKTIFLSIFITLAMAISCSNDDEGCRKSGALSGTWSDGQALRFNYNIFTEETDNKFGVQSTFDAEEFCAPRVGLSITNLSKTLERQQLIRYNGDGIFVGGTVYVGTMDTDALTELYLLDTLQPHWIEINEVGTDRIKGVLNATFALEEATVNKAWNFPDTLRFKEEYFEFVKRRE